MDLQGIFSSIADVFLARTKGYREQAGRQDREARARVAEILRTWQRKLQQEEARREAIQRHDTMIVREDDLRMIDCVGVAWQIIDALGNPLIHPRARARAEHDLARIIGNDYVDLLRTRREQPERPRSMNDMNSWMRELVSRDVGYSFGKRRLTIVEEMIDEATDPARVRRVRRQVERMMARVLR